MSQRNQDPEPFSPTHHALLFAWIAREVQKRAGKPLGEAIMRRAVRRYGEQRGRRMALRALADRQPLDMTTFLAYGEWQAAEGMFDSRMESQPGAVRSLVLRCPWNQAWADYGLNDSGRLYCLEIDAAISRGFNPANQLEVKGTLSNGAEASEFVYHAASLEALSQQPVDHTRTVLPWDYHLGHLYKTAGEVICEEMGEAGQAAMQAALAQFARQFGEEAAETVLAFRDTDFDALPEDYSK
jgi:hypothetical protein